MVSDVALSNILLSIIKSSDDMLKIEYKGSRNIVLTNSFIHFNLFINLLLIQFNIPWQLSIPLMTRLSSYQINLDYPDVVFVHN